MTTFPNSPRLIKGGLVTLDATTGAVKRIIALQYNPDTLSRTLAAQSVGKEGAGAKTTPLRMTGPPVETISVEAEMDAADQLEFPDQNRLTVEQGVRPSLDALETLLYPSSAQLIRNNGLANSGALEILPVEGPLTVFVWSRQRVVPVRITEFSVTEEAFDPNLNPLRAKVKLSLRVLTVNDVGFVHRAGALSLIDHRKKEELTARSMNAAFGALGLSGSEF